MKEQSPNPEMRVSTVESIVASTPEVAGLQAYEYFRSNAVEQKSPYISGDRDSLELTYPELREDTMLELDRHMSEALVTLMPGEKSAKSEALYRAVEYRYSELSMLDMARVMNSDDFSDEVRAEARQSFRLANEGLYGAPDETIFNSLMRKNVVGRLVPQPNDSDGVANLRADLANMIGIIGESDFEPFMPDNETVARIGALVHERFDELVEHIDPNQIYDVVGMVGALQTAADKLGAAELGWEVVIVPNSSALAVAAHKKQIEVGQDRAKIDGEKLKGRVLHEEGVHMGRSINAEKAGWLSAAYGQDGYLEFEEAFATAIEDAYKGEFINHGEQLYVIAGLAYGLDHHPQRNFGEVFEIMWRSKALEAVVDGSVSDKDVHKAKSSAFSACMRLFRGTDTQQPGVVYLKDLAYFNGQERAWSFLKGVMSQEDLDIAFAGKLDLTRSDHLEIAQQIVANT